MRVNFLIKITTKNYSKCHANNVTLWNTYWNSMIVIIVNWYHG